MTSKLKFNWPNFGLKSTFHCTLLLPLSSCWAFPIKCTPCLTNMSHLINFPTSIGSNGPELTIDFNVAVSSSSQSTHKAMPLHDEELK